MKRLLLLFAAILMASTGMWAETVDYLYPVYNTDGVPTSGIKEWKTASVDATVVEDASEPVTWTAGWYVVTGTNVKLSKGAICSGNVHLILADGAKLTATGWDDLEAEIGWPTYAGIQVSDDGNSLTIYGQAYQTGQLEANGGTDAAGIGGGSYGSGSNITINGGIVTANGKNGAGIGGGYQGDGYNITINGGTVTANGGQFGAGIGGGLRADGSNITINGGTVTANGDVYTSGVGGGYLGSSNNIRVATTLLVKADGNNPPTEEIEHDGGDIAGKLHKKRYATIVSILPFRDAAIAAIDAAFKAITNENMKAIATTAKKNIEAATTTMAIGSIKEKALADLHIYNTGKADAFGTLSEKQNGPALIVTDKDDKEVILYSPKSVEYIKVKE